MNISDYKRINYLKKQRKKYGLPEGIIIANPYKSIIYSRKKIELMPSGLDDNFVKIFDECFYVKVLANNYMYDLLDRQFRDCPENIPPYYYKRIFDDFLIKCFLHDKSFMVPVGLYNAVYNRKIPTDIILYAFAGAQSIYAANATDAKKASYKNNKMFIISASRLISYEKDIINIDPFGFIETMEVKPRIYKKKSLLKIYINEYDQYYLTIGRRVDEELKDTSKEIERIEHDSVTGIPIEVHKVQEF